MTARPGGGMRLGMVDERNVIDSVAIDVRGCGMERVDRIIH